MTFHSILFVSIIFSYFIAACSTSLPMDMHANKDLKLVLIKSNNISFYDFAFLEINPELAIDFFKFGKSIGRLVVKDREICFVDDCAPKWGASRAFFGNVGYDTLFEEILLKKDIFNGIGKSISKDGVVIQQFDFSENKFYYERSKNRVYFKNITSNIIISIEDYTQ